MHEYQVQYWATDGDDPQPAGLESILIAIDRTRPVVVVNMASPSILWPPNRQARDCYRHGHRRGRPLGVNSASLRFAVADEYGKVRPSGAIVDVSGSAPTAFGGFEMVNFSFRVSLQARRFGYDFDGRQYSIGVYAQDLAGNVGTAGTVVTVPHDMGHHVGAQNGRHRGSSGKHNGSQGSGGNLGTGSGTTHGHGPGIETPEAGRLTGMATAMGTVTDRGRDRATQLPHRAASKVARSARFRIRETATVTRAMETATTMETRAMEMATETKATAMAMDKAMATVMAMGAESGVAPNDSSRFKALLP